MATAPQKQSRTKTAISVFTKAALSSGVLYTAAKLVHASLRKPLDLRGKIALITGSRGLGLAIARELGGRGARIALCARTASELERACEILAREHIEAVAFPADISNPSEISPLIAKVLDRFGQIDVLVNNAGEITVGPLRSFTHADFERAMNLMFWGALNLSLAVLPYMKQRRSGHIVNITSIGGRVSVPHLLPYSCAKFALVGFSTGLSTEVRSQGVHVLTVVPGLMRTGSYLHANFKGNAKREFAWFGVLANLPGFSVGAGYAARQIRNALLNNRHLCTISLPAKMLIASEALIPETTRTVLQAVNRFLLPNANDADQALHGSILNTEFGRMYQALTVLGRRAAHDLNE